MVTDRLYILSDTTFSASPNLPISDLVTARTHLGYEIWAYIAKFCLLIYLLVKGHTYVTHGLHFRMQIRTSSNLLICDTITSRPHFGNEHIMSAIYSAQEKDNKGLLQETWCILYVTQGRNIDPGYDPEETE